VSPHPAIHVQCTFERGPNNHSMVTGGRNMGRVGVIVSSNLDIASSAIFTGYIRLTENVTMEASTLCTLRMQ
jgi:ribosomal protein S4E